MSNQSKLTLMKSPLMQSAFLPSLMRQFSLFDEEMDEDFKSMGASNISLSEDDKHVYVEANMPGLKDNEIEITFDKGILWIKGEHKESEENKKRKFYYKTHRSFSYRIAVPGDIDPKSDPAAKYENGVIHVTFNKSQKEMPRKIELKKS